MSPAIPTITLPRARALSTTIDTTGGWLQLLRVQTTKAVRLIVAIALQLHDGLVISATGSATGSSAINSCIMVDGVLRVLYAVNVAQLGAVLV